MQTLLQFPRSIIYIFPIKSTVIVANDNHVNIILIQIIQCSFNSGNDVIVLTPKVVSW